MPLSSKPFSHQIINHYEADDDDSGRELLLRPIFFFSCTYKLKPRIDKIGYHSWQDWKQMENCGRIHPIRGWRGTSLLQQFNKGSCTQ
jgi:hypothetical protein